MKTKKIFKKNKLLIHIILIIVSVSMLIPFLWMILTAFKSTVYKGLHRVGI